MRKLICISLTVITLAACTHRNEMPSVTMLNQQFGQVRELNADSVKYPLVNHYPRFGFWITNASVDPDIYSVVSCQVNIVG